jgi:hypothetical protein
MNDIRKISVALLFLVVLALPACKPPGPPSDKIVEDLLNEYNGEAGEYIFDPMVECLVEPDEVDVVEAWGVEYWRTDVDGGFNLFVRVVRNSAGEWSISDRDTCITP